jgi:hypothetical protein
MAGRAGVDAANSNGAKHTSRKGVLMEDSPFLGECKALKKLAATKGPLSESGKAGTVDKGEVLFITEVREVKNVGEANKRMRGLCASGWVTLSAKTVLSLDALAAEKAPRQEGKRSQRRMSVALDGVSGVSEEAKRVAESLGVTAEQLFDVTQRHLDAKKVPPKVQLKVGAMGIQVVR